MQHTWLCRDFYYDYICTICHAKNFVIATAYRIILFSLVWDSKHGEGGGGGGLARGAISTHPAPFSAKSEIIQTLKIGAETFKGVKSRLKVCFCP